MRSLQVFVLSLIALVICANGQYFPYPSFDQRGFSNIPTQIIDLPSAYGQNNQTDQIGPNGQSVQIPTVNNFGNRIPYYGGYFPYPYNFGVPQSNGYNFMQQYPNTQYPVPHYPNSQQPNIQYPSLNSQKSLVTPNKQLPKSYFKNPTAEFPNGYWVIPGSQTTVGPTPISKVITNGTRNETVHEFPDYIVKQTSEKHQTTNIRPVKITTSKVEYRPLHTVLTRYIGKDGKPVVKFQTENGTIFLNGQDSTSLNINNGQVKINGADPSDITTTPVIETTTISDDDATPKDISSWLSI